MGDTGQHSSVMGGSHSACPSPKPVYPCGAIPGTSWCSCTWPWGESRAGPKWLAVDSGKGLNSQEMLEGLLPGLIGSWLQGCKWGMGCGETLPPASGPEGRGWLGSQQLPAPGAAPATAAPEPPFTPSAPAAPSPTPLSRLCTPPAKPAPVPFMSAQSHTSHSSITTTSCWNRTILSFICCCHRQHIWLVPVVGGSEPEVAYPVGLEVSPLPLDIGHAEARYRRFL